MTLALILICALLLDAVLGEPKWLWSHVPHPAVVMGRVITLLDRSLNNGNLRRAKGALCILILLGIAVTAGLVLSQFGAIIEVIVATILLAHRSLVDHVAAVAAGLRENLSEGRTAVSMIVSRDTADMDETLVARAAIESAAENFSDGVVAPALWFLMCGLPGLIAYKMVNTADSMIGYRTEKYEAFGWAAARLDDLMNLIPARATALLVMLVAGRRDIGAIRADARLHRSPNAGWPEAAMSRALGIALSGPRAYDGKLQDFPWVNPDGRRTLTPVDINAAISMLWKTWGALVLLIALLGLLTF